MGMKYRVTPRGKVVFSAAGIILLILLFMLIQSLTTEPLSEPVDVPSTNEMSTQENEDTSNVTDGEQEGSGDIDETASEATEIEEVRTDNTADTDSELTEEADTEASVSPESMEALTNAKTTVYFAPDKYDLNDEYKLVLNIFIGVAETYPNEYISIEGNINGYPKFNDSKFGEELSEIRANKVAQYLMNLGIDENRLIVKSNGSSKPLNKTDSKEELMLNRRTDIFFTDYYLEEEINMK